MSSPFLKKKVYSDSIPDTQEAEIRRIEVRSQPRQIVLETLSRKIPSQKRSVGVAQGVGPEFKPQCHKKKKKLRHEFGEKPSDNSMEGGQHWGNIESPSEHPL
jgi:hypothetical protein